MSGPQSQTTPIPVDQGSETNPLPSPPAQGEGEGVPHRIDGSGVEPYLITIELDGRYEGWWAEMDGDPDSRTIIQLSSQGLANQMAAVMRLVVRWNFRDKDTGEIVAPTTEDVMRVPLRAILQLAGTYGSTFLSALPNPRGDDSPPTSSISPDPPKAAAGRRRRSNTPS